MNFSSVICPICKKSLAKTTEVKYTVFWSPEIDQLNMFGSCSADQYYDRRIDPSYFRQTPATKNIVVDTDNGES